MITLYLNAVMEMVKMGGEENAPPNIEMLMRYLSFPRRFSPLSTNNADMLLQARWSFQTCSALLQFERCSGRHQRMTQARSESQALEKLESLEGNENAVDEETDGQPPPEVLEAAEVGLGESARLYRLAISI